ncbi:MerR family transcriptional regulator [Bacillus cereus]|uniref:MerR family transcriptional regulator n=1 Tax=Bacillus cereus TaxID=1396 RepID=UPI0015D4A782|nr:MerR family transcriptional regulator [Bacillus cereus]
MNDFGYYAKTVAEDIKISPNTLRRWSIELEKHGYQIERNEKNNRIYYERDYKAFRELKKLLDAGISMESATLTITNAFKSNDNALVTSTVQEQENTETERYLMRDEEKIKLMLQEAMAQVASNTIEPILSELHEVKNELVEQRRENIQLKEILQNTLLQMEKTVMNQNEKLLIESKSLKQELVKDGTENKELKKLLEGMEKHTNQLEKQLEEVMEIQKQQANKTFFQRLFKK